MFLQKDKHQSIVRNAMKSMENLKGKKITAAASAVPFIGNGKLTDYKKEGSWIMNQMEKGEVDNGIKVSDESGSIRFAEKRCSRIAAKLVASSCENICICRFFKALPQKDNYNYQYGLKWVLRCGIESATITELNSMSELLNTFVEEDQMKLDGCSCYFDGFSGAVIDFKNGDIKTECLVHFPATAVMDAVKAAETLKKMGFVSCDETVAVPQQKNDEEQQGE